MNYFEMSDQELKLFEKSRTLDRDLRNILLQTGDTTVDDKVPSEKVQKLKQRLKYERDSKLKVQTVLDKNVKIIAMLTDHVEKLVFFLDISQKAKLKAERTTRDLRKECSRLRTVIEKQQLGLSVHQKLIVQLRSTSSVLEEQLFSMDDSFLRKEYREKLFMNDFVTGMKENLKSNVVSLIKELQEPKSCLTRKKKNPNQIYNNADEECKNEINILSDTVRTKQVNLMECNHGEGASENDNYSHDKNHDSNKINNDFNTNHNDKYNDNKRIVDIGDIKNEKIFHSNNYNENYKIIDNDESNHNNNVHDDDNNNYNIHHSKDFKKLCEDPFAFEAESDNDYDDDDFDSDVQNKLCLHNEISIYDKMSLDDIGHGNDGQNIINIDSSNDSSNDNINNNKNKIDSNVYKKCHEEANLIDNNSDITISPSDIIHTTQIVEKKGKKDFKKETKIRPKSAGGTISAPNDDLKLLMTRLGFGVENEKTKNSISVAHIKNKLIDYEKKCNNTTENSKYSSDIKKTEKVKEDCNDWRNFFLNDELLNPETFFKNKKSNKFQKNPEIKRIDKIINKIRRKNDLLETDTKWTPKKLLDLVENKRKHE